MGIFRFLNCINATKSCNASHIMNKIAEAQKSVTNLPSNKNGNTLCTGLTNNWNALDNP